MRHLTTILAASLLAGCASQSTPGSTQTAAADPLAGPHAASALAFDPPIALNMTAPDLSRDARGGAALVGFEEPSTSTYDVFTYNSQASDYSDYYDQEAYSERVGVTHR